MLVGEDEIILSFQIELQNTRHGKSDACQDKAHFHSIMMVKVTTTALVIVW